MKTKYTKYSFENVINIKSIITLFYMELSKNFKYDGERHNFWEMVYIDQGEMHCIADDKSFVLKSGELVFHKPNEFHNLMGDSIHSPNVSIITFECSSQALYKFVGKIFKLNSDEKSMLSLLFEEGLSCYSLEDETNPLIQKIYKKDDAPFGSSQMIKNILEIFLIQLSRNNFVATTNDRRNHLIDGVTISNEIKVVLDYMNEKLCDSISVHQIAKQLNCSESYLKKEFAKYYKGGIIKYFNSLKIKEAKHLIRNEKMSMAEISEKLGFDNPQYFSRCFKQFAHIVEMQSAVFVPG